MSLLDILTGAGNVLDTPGSFARGLLSGQADRAFGGIFDPSQRVSGRDMLDRWGIDGGELGGLAAGIATDPLMWGGGALLRLLGRGGEAAAAGARAADLGGDAAQASKAATLLEAAPGVGGYKKLADGTIQRIEALAPESASSVLPGGIVNRGVNKPLSEMEQWTGKMYSMGAPAEMATGGGTAGSVSNLLPLRREFTMLKDVGLDASGQPISRAVGGLTNAANPAARARQVYGAGNEIAQDALEAASQGGQMHGVYVPSARTGAIMEGALPGTVRHETGHGLMDIARETGRISDLPSMLARTSARLQNTQSPMAQALGLMGEETWTHGLGAGRGALNQARGGTEFLMNPNQFYGQQFRELSPLVSALYGTSAIPRTAAFGTALAGGVPAAALLSSFGE